MRITLKDGSIFDDDLAVYNDNGASRQVPQGAMQAYKNGFLDANGTVFFARQLEHIKAKVFEVEYADLMALQLFPMSNAGGRGVTSITYRVYDKVGSAKIINAYADDLPRADISGKEVSVPVRAIGTSIGYNVDEVDAASISGMSLEQRRANAARRAVDEEVDNIAWHGSAEHGLPGLFSNPNIPMGNVVDGGSGTAWTTKTAEQILFDVNDLFQTVYEVTKKKERPNKLCLPVAQWGHIMSSPRSAASDMTIAQYIANNSPFLNSVDDIIALNELSAANNPALASDTMFIFDQNPDKVEFEYPVPLEFFAPQMHNLEFVVPARARVAGLNIYAPMSMAFGSGI